ncbi:MAG: hypothetical protein HFF90_11215 [Oscillibacter sp.]|nr:hypothetical protein [Oscillibacter sp.]
MTDYEILEKMYAIVYGSADTAITEIDEQNYGMARETLKKALEDVEELYISRGEA